MRKTSQIKHIFCLLIFLIICISPAIGHHYDFKQIGSKSGMPSIISCIYTEQKGFIWIGTPQGLIRFDGEELKNTPLNRTTRIPCPATVFSKLSKTTSKPLGY